MSSTHSSPPTSHTTSIELTVMALEQLSFEPELAVMASKHYSLGPATNRLNCSDHLVVPPLTFTHQQLESLFAPLFTENVE